ncbi:hypothetical protein BDD12DRAFT_460897 [Trichophaea hybrida]|nr:hypothetical protein BDD12DRAFT_460897 [Trichophaea hybrida]
MVYGSLVFFFLVRLVSLALLVGLLGVFGLRWHFLHDERACPNYKSCDSSRQTVMDEPMKAPVIPLHRALLVIRVLNIVNAIDSTILCCCRRSL